jgi:hypothetical protein
MLKITCNNRVCGTSFFFDEKKNPKATKVMCPKCKQIQPLQGGFVDAPKDDEEDFNWLKGNDKPAYSAPVIPSSIELIDDMLRDEPSQENFFQKKQPKKEQIPALSPTPQRVQRGISENEEAIGWLVIHDEYTDTYTFNLRKGINRIGRDSDSTSLDVNIRIKTKDQYMSRHHCDIEVRWKTRKSAHEYVLSDKAYQGKKASSNGTFLNAGNRLSAWDEILLKDGDTIQVGRTKLVLKLPSDVGSSRDAENWVKETDYFKTIIQ